MAVPLPRVWTNAPNATVPNSVTHTSVPYFSARVQGSRDSPIATWDMEQIDFMTNSPYWWTSTITGFTPTPGSKSNFDTIITDPPDTIPYSGSSFYSDWWHTVPGPLPYGPKDWIFEEVARAYQFNGFDIKYARDWLSTINWIPEDFVFQEYNYTTNSWESWARDPSLPYPNSKAELPADTYQVVYLETELADGKTHRYYYAQGSWLNGDGSIDYYADQCFRAKYNVASELYAYQQCSFVSLEISGNFESYLDSYDPNLWDSQDPTRINWNGLWYVNNYSVTPVGSYTVDRWGYIDPPSSSRTFAVTSMPDWGGVLVQQETAPAYTYGPDVTEVPYSVSIPYTDFLALGIVNDLTENTVYFAPGWNWTKYARSYASINPVYTYSQPHYRLIGGTIPPLRMIQRQDAAWPSPHPSSRMNRPGTGGLSTSVQFPGTPRIVQPDGSGNTPGSGGSYL